MELDNDVDITMVDVSDTKLADANVALLKSTLKNDSNDAKSKEIAIYKLGEIYAALGQPEQLRQLIFEIRPFFSQIPKARTAKIVRKLIDLVGNIPNTLELQAELCKESIEWCVQEKRTFLKQRIQARLAEIMLRLKQYNEAIKLITRLAREVKKIDDKLLLVEIHLIESKVHHSLQNVPKSKGALTAARSAANAIYCPPLLQAQIDMQAGVLCSEEKDYKTGFSYFFEAFENYNTVNMKKEAKMALKYMLLCKIMVDSSSEVYTIINGKIGIEYAGVEVDAMRAIADAHKERSIHAYAKVKDSFRAQLLEDPIVLRHLNQLYDNLLESHLIRLIEPFSRIEIPQVAKLIELPVEQVESKLSEMILDQKLNGTLDQGAGVLIVFDETQQDGTFDAALDTIKELNSVVDKLYKKARKLH